METSVKITFLLAAFSVLIEIYAQNEYSENTPGINKQTIIIFAMLFMNKQIVLLTI